MMRDRPESVLELLIRINHDVAGALDLRSVLQRLILAATEHVGAERASIIVVDESGKPVDASILYGTTLHHHTTRQLRETLERGLAGWVIRSQEPALVTDTSEDDRWLQRPDDAADRSGAKSAVCVPLVARGQVVGALTLVHPTPGTFRQEHVELAQAIADQASIAVLNAQLYSSVSQQARIMTALVESAASFGSSLDLQETHERVLRQVLQALQVETAVIGMLDGSEGELVLQAAAGQNAAQLIGRTNSLHQGPVAEVLARGQSHIVDGIGLDGEAAPLPAFRGLEVHVMMLAPIEARGKPTGILFAVNPVAGRFAVGGEAVLRGIGALAGATIQNAQLHERLRGAQRRYMELFEESFDLVVVTDLEGRITEANRQAARVTGLAPEQLRKMGIGQLHTVDWNQVGKGFAGLRRLSTVRYESVLQTGAGEAVPVEVRAIPIEVSGAGSILWTLHDLTERKQLDELRTNLISMVFHDLRSPLSNLSSSLELLREVLPEEDGARSAFEIAEHSVRRMSRLVDSLLDISRLEAGHKLLVREPAQPAELVRAAVRDVAPLADSRNQGIQTETTAGLPDILVDGDMLRRVLVNLLENALKFSGPGSGVEVGVREDGDTIEFWVQDHGPGIRAEDQKRIFEKFAHLRSASDGPAGIGLGLTFCQLAARAHDGDIRVESGEGKGARFVMRLPAGAVTV